MYKTHLLYSARQALVTTVLIAMLGVSAFFAFEPSVSRGQQTDQFVVSQQITNEISFRTVATDVAMVGSITGLTGGYATGTSVVVVNTNNLSGYSMTLHFATTTSGHAMVASSSSSSMGYINDYSNAGGVGVPDYDWVTNSTGQAAEFGYNVQASSSAEVDASFKNNGSACNVGSTVTENKCWLNPTTTPETIINSTVANAYSTTSIKFKVAVPSNPSPALPARYYYATGTLTATTNP